MFCALAFKHVSLGRRPLFKTHQQTSLSTVGDAVWPSLRYQKLIYLTRQAFPDTVMSHYKMDRAKCAVQGVEAAAGSANQNLRRSVSYTPTPDSDSVSRSLLKWIGCLSGQLLPQVRNKHTGCHLPLTWGTAGQTISSHPHHIRGTLSF